VSRGYRQFIAFPQAVETHTQKEKARTEMHGPAMDSRWVSIPVERGCAMSRPVSAEELLQRIRTARDTEWTQTVLGVTDKVLTPEQAAEWLEKDRRQRAHKVSEARQRRGPVYW